VTRTLHTLFAFLLLAVLALGSAACAGGSSEADDGGDAAQAGEDNADGEDGTAKEDQAVPVEVVELERGPIEAVLRYSTNLEAEEEVGVYSQASRQVRRLNVEEGSRVRRGQVLVTLQDDEQRTRVAKVRSQLERARREHGRQTRLFEQDLISEQAFNDATYELDQLELELEDAQRELSYTDVTAPISGTVTRRYVGVGDQVTMNQHLFDLVDFDSIVARVYVPEKELGRLQRGQPARVTAPALGAERLFRGTVDRLSPVVDPASGTLKVTVDIPPQEGLRPGMYVDVQLVTDVRDDALLVPKRAVVYDDDQLFVYRMDPEAGTVERVYLRPVLEDEQWIQPAGGLEPGDRGVVAGPAGLKDGAKVRLAGEKPPAADAAAEAAE
jgi:membrane fusion protein (multidrug efflux system)